MSFFDPNMTELNEPMFQNIPTPSPDKTNQTNPFESQTSAIQEDLYDLPFQMSPVLTHIIKELLDEKINPGPILGAFQLSGYNEPYHVAITLLTTLNFNWSHHAVLLNIRGLLVDLYSWNLGPTYNQELPNFKESYASRKNAKRQTHANAVC